MEPKFTGLLQQIEELTTNLIEKLKNKTKDAVGSGDQIISLAQQLVEKDRAIADLNKQLSEAKLAIAQEMMNERQQQSDIAAAHVEAEKYQLQANVAEQQVNAAAIQSASLRSAIELTQKEKTAEREEVEHVETQLKSLLSEIKAALESQGGEEDSKPEMEASAPKKTPEQEPVPPSVEPESQESAVQPVAHVEGEPQLSPLVPGVDPTADSESFVSKPLEEGVTFTPATTTLVEPKETQPIKPVGTSKKRRM